MDEGDLEEMRVHEAIWQSLYDRVRVIFSSLVRQGIITDSDFWVVEDDWGWDIVQTELTLIPAWPDIVEKFQVILAKYPEWQITIRVLQSDEEGWPGMGVVISHGGIIDDLKREYLPAGLQTIAFPGAIRRS